MDYSNTKNTRQHKAPTGEPRKIIVEVELDDGRSMMFVNDGITTSRQESGNPDITTILQNRPSFRGFIMGMTNLMGWRITDARGDSSAVRDLDIDD